jgi:hypothetical protein
VLALPSVAGASPLLRVKLATPGSPKPSRPSCLPLMQGNVRRALHRRISRQACGAPRLSNASDIEHNPSMIQSTSLIDEPRSQAKVSQQSQSEESMLGQSACGKVEPRQYTKLMPVHTVPPNPSIEGTASGLRPPAAPHVKR